VTDRVSVILMEQGVYSMRKLLNKVRRFGKDEEGAALVEYTVLLGILLVGVIVLIGSVGTWISNHWNTLYTAISSY
jgi:pilus assembly protein Flp/PilA